MKKIALLLPLLFLPSLASCGGEEAKPVFLDFGTRVGLDETVSPRSHLTFVKKSKVNQLIEDKGNFILLLHGASDTCTCYTEFHRSVLVPYVKHHKALIYAIDLEEFESDSHYYGIERIVGVDTLAIFKNGELAFQHTNKDLTEKWTYDYATFNTWMGERVNDARIFYIDEDLLDSYYLGSEPFTVYFGLENCPDCRFLNRGGLREYLGKHEVTEANFFYFDMAPYWKDAELKAEKKAKYGLSYSEENPVGFEAGYVPSVYFINPDGIHFDDDVIEAAGCFYNETNVDGKVGHSYFTAERLASAKNSYLGYLEEANLATKVIEGLEVGPVPEGTNKHTLIAPYEDPIFFALLDYAIGA